MIRFSQNVNFSSKNQHITDDLKTNPHPTTPYSMGENSANGRGEQREEADGLSGYISSDDSPQGTRQRVAEFVHDQQEQEHDENGQGKNDSDDAEAEDTGNEELSNEDREWLSFTETVKPEDCPNLAAYLAAKSAREAAKENFRRVLDECGTGLREAMIEEMLQDSVVAIHQEQGERFDAHEADIISTFVSNHQRRRAMIECMDEADRNWSRTYKRLRGDIELEQGHEKSNEDSAGKRENGGAANTEQSRGKDTLGGEPNWDDLAAFKHSRESIQSFLDARGNFHNAEESLKQALDDIHAGLQAEVDSILDVAVQIHNEHESSCIDLEQDIQYHLMQNNKRRDALQQRLEESAKQAQGVFANLLSRLSMKL